MVRWSCSVGLDSRLIQFVCEKHLCQILYVLFFFVVQRLCRHTPLFQKSQGISYFLCQFIKNLPFSFLEFLVEG